MPPRLTSRRLVLRPYTEAERVAFVSMFTDPVMMAHIDGALPPEAAELLFSELVGLAPLRGRVHSAWAVYEGDAYVAHAVLLNEGDDLEIGFMVVPGNHGRGLATEIAAALIHHGLHDLGRAKLIATVDDANYASRRVLEKVGMKPVRKEEDAEGAWWVWET